MGECSRGERGRSMKDLATYLHTEVMTSFLCMLLSEVTIIAKGSQYFGCLVIS